jgi:SAM-dependent methyltransferase
VCWGERAAPFLPIKQVPVSCNHLCSSRDLALTEPRADISLAFCPDCEHVFNAAYDPDQVKYRPGYENSLRGSDVFREYDETLVNTLVERYRLRRRLIVEIGCGRGEFLKALCQRGGNRGIGFDPSYGEDDIDSNGSSNVVIRPEAYGAQDVNDDADFICSRHTLEHVGDPRGFLSNIRKATALPATPVFFEVPNGLFTLRDGGIWDIIYEHCSYFTPCSLARVFRETGYQPIEVEEAFGRQFLSIHAMTDIPDRKNGFAAGPATPGIKDLVESFARKYQCRLQDWSSKLSGFEEDEGRVVVWGAGAKATTFLNLLRPGTIDFVVDVNPRKHGKYIIGTGQQIVPPEFLREYSADVILCMNPQYFSEIARQLREMDVAADLLAA